MRRVLCAVMALTLSGAACSKGGDRPEVAVVVEGTKIASSETEQIVDAYLQRQQTQSMGEDAPRDQVAKWVLEYQIKLSYLEYLAGTLGVSSEEESYFDAAADLIKPQNYGAMGQRREDFARELRAGRLSLAMAKKLNPNVSISDAALQAEYDRRGPLLDRAWKATAQVARFTTEESATQVRQRVPAEAFADAAKALGAGEVVTVDINPVVAPLPAALLDAVGQLPPGGVSEAIPAGGAWLVVRVERRQAVPRLTLEDLRPELTDFLAERQRRDLFQEWFDKKFPEAKVKVSSYYGKWDSELTLVE